ncbi:MAG TPA: proline--tRNA ligase [Nanoarchaeota archaeon]|nr:proline--tRNA ligase [Nanoarchaeota archaeon]
MALKNKKENFSEWYTELVSESGAHLADIRYGIQGAIVETPWAVKIIRAFEAMFEKEVEADGHEPMLFPSIVPEAYIKKEKEHVAGFAPELYWVTEGGGKKLDEKFYLRPTGESQIFPMYSIWLRSWNQLPLKRYQSRISVFRFETTTRPYLRGREFNFFECHDIFATHEEALTQIKHDMSYCENVIHKRLGLPFIFVRRPQWDKFAGAVDTYGAETIVDGKVNTVTSTHDFGQKFAKAYEIKFTDKTENKQFGWQTTLGPGIIRIMAGLIGIHGDNYGLVLPFEIAPVQIVIVPVFFEKNISAVDKKCKELGKTLQEKNYRVKYDDSENTAGWKFNEWEMKGVPIRIEVGPREVKEKNLTLVRRDTKQKEVIREKDLDKKIISLSNDILKNITKKAETELKNSITDAKTFADLKKIIETKRGIIRAPFCSIDFDGQKCADKLQNELSVKVRGTLFNKNEKASGKCIVCGKPAKHIVYVAKSY